MRAELKGQIVVRQGQLAVEVEGAGISSSELKVLGRTLDSPH